MISTIFLDFDGVIRHWDSSGISQSESKLGLKQGTLFSVAFSKDFLFPAITGKTTHDKWQESVFRKLSSNHTEIIAQELIKAWKKAQSTIDLSFLRDIKDAAPECQLVLTTNATSILRDELQAANLDSYFAHIVNSFEIGVSKPDAEYFIKAMKLSECIAQQVTFIDDSENNILVARELGIQSHHYRNAREALQFVKQQLTKANQKE
ncbi:HAD family hydrolase [Vibrio nigripulchritudo]|uniref:HAD family hydrolase n=1 Tax=Vibrio nigripulchritudo TaxID=28173 RepID=UPI00249270FB|nr:HAD-IA family hydrolase [Vibrio nigripulchritudo]